MIKKANYGSNTSRKGMPALLRAFNFEKAQDLVLTKKYKKKQKRKYPVEYSLV